MKIIIKNWGPIANCEYDLDKAMIVTYGENNIGKSYAMQVVYLLLKHLILRSQSAILYYSDAYMHFYVPRQGEKPEIRSLLMDFVMDGTIEIKDISEHLISYLSIQLEEELMEELSKSFENTFGIYDQILQENPEIILDLEHGILCKLDMKHKKMKLNMQVKPVFLKKSGSEFHKSRENKKRYDIYVFENHISTPIELVERRLADVKATFYRAVVSVIDAVYFLPASRSGIYTGMQSFGPVLAQLSQNRAMIRGTIQIPSISEPVSDYYLALSSIRTERRSDLREIAREIERTILKGEVLFDTKKKTIIYKREDLGQVLEMNDASSMVSEIAPITAYLKYIVVNGKRRISRKPQETEERKPCSLIFIEEPEAHLHPSNQVILMKKFVKLSKENVKLMMASHSNYVFNELNNRVLAGDLVSDDYSPILMKMEQGKSRTYTMHTDEFGTQDDNFVDVAETLYEERENLILELVRKREAQ